MTATLLLVGCGKMGGAMARGWLAGGVARLAIVEPSPDTLPDEFRGDPRIAAVADPSGLDPAFRPDAVVLAVKPQYMDAALPAYANYLGQGALGLSIAAGKTLDYFARAYGAAAFVRSMPNLPASIGRGITVAVANASVSPIQKALASQLLAACGEVDWVEDETLIDVVTATSGGGPAYLFLLAESLAAAGEKAGLPADLAMRLARVTMSGAGELLAQSPLSPAELRQAVSSPGGTTLAALAELEPLRGLMDRAIEAATRRSRELAS